MRESYSLTVKIVTNGDFASVKRLLNQVAKMVNMAAAPRNMPIGWSGSGGGGYSESYFIEFSSPIEAQVKELRAEADRLEATL